MTAPDKKLAGAKVGSRACLTCGVPIERCMAFTLGRDVLALTDGEKAHDGQRVLRLCDVNGKMLAWIHANPTDKDTSDAH